MIHRKFNICSCPVGFQVNGSIVKSNVYDVWEVFHDGIMLLRNPVIIEGIVGTCHKEELQS